MKSPSLIGELLSLLVYTAVSLFFIVTGILHAALGAIILATHARTISFLWLLLGAVEVLFSCYAAKLAREQAWNPLMARRKYPTWV